MAKKNRGPTDPRDESEITLLTPQFRVNGKRFAKIGGVWCAETRREGKWRSAEWMGAISTHELFDYLYKVLGTLESLKDDLEGIDL